MLNRIISLFNNPKDEQHKDREKLIKMFPHREREACEYLRWLIGQIIESCNSQNYPQESIDKLKRNLDFVLGVFVELLGKYIRRKDFLATTNRELWINQIKIRKEQIEELEKYEEESSKLTINLQKENILLLEERLNLIDELNNSVLPLEAQLQMIEILIGLTHTKSIEVSDKQDILVKDFNSVLDKIHSTYEFLDKTEYLIGKLSNL
jgi:hypothetical protein